ASFGQPITEYDPASRGMQDFEELARWLIANPPEPPQVAEPEIEALAATGTTGPHGPGANPAMSRAAELVERARALATRTAQLSSRLASDTDVIREVGPAIHQPRIDTPSTL